MSEDLVKVIIDYKCAPKSKKPDIETGGYILIHKGKKFTKMPRTCGLSLVCEGKKIKI